METRSAAALIKQVANGEKSSRDLTREEARWLFHQALTGRLSDLQLGALLATWRLKGEAVPELAGCLDAVQETTTAVPYSGRRPLVAHCGTASGKHQFFLSAPAAAVLAAATGIDVLICGRSGAEQDYPATEIDVFRHLGLHTDLSPAEVADALDRNRLAVCEQRRFNPGLARLSDLRKPLGMRTVAQSVEKYAFPVRPTAALAGAFHIGYLRRLAQAVATVFDFPLYLLQERDGAIDPRPVHPTRGFAISHGQASEWECTPERAGILPQDRHAFAPLSAAQTAAVTREVLAGAQAGPLREMILYNAGLLIHAARPEVALTDGVAIAREALQQGAGRELLSRIARPLTASFGR